MLKLYLTVFFGRMVDVTLGTIRTFTSVKGRIQISFILGFFEALLYFIVIRSALVDNSNILLTSLIYSLGYASGILFGTYISHNKLNQNIVLEAVTKDNNNMLSDLRKKGYIFSTLLLDNSYDSEKRRLIYFQISTKKIKSILDILRKYDKNVFYIINDIKENNSFIK